jgi:vesicle coat complex subunit
VAEIERLERLGVLVNGEVMADATIGFLTVVRTRLLGLPSLLGSNFSKLRSAHEAVDWLQKQVYEALEQLSTFDMTELLAEARRKHPNPFEPDCEARVDDGG